MSSKGFTEFGEVRLTPEGDEPRDGDRVELMVRTTREPLGTGTLHVYEEHGTMAVVSSTGGTTMIAGYDDGMFLMERV